jgi:hypothetical protein
MANHPEHLLVDYSMIYSYASACSTTRPAYPCVLNEHNLNVKHAVQVPCQTSDSWEALKASLNDAQEFREVLGELPQCDCEGCVAIALFSSRTGAELVQGSALPGMCIAALLTALDACSCSPTIVTSSEAVRDALEQFGYHVTIGP